MERTTCKGRVYRSRMFTAGICGRKALEGQEFCKQHLKPGADTKTARWWKVNLQFDTERLVPVEVCDETDSMVTIIEVSADGSVHSHKTKKITEGHKLFSDRAEAYRFQTELLTNRVRKAEINLANCEARLLKATIQNPVD